MDTMNNNGNNMDMDMSTTMENTMDNNMDMGMDNNNHNMHMDMTSSGKSSSFCNGDGMVMSMNGFRFNLKEGHSCLNLWFESWTLDTRGKFVAAMLGIILAAVCVEALSQLRHWITQRAKKARRNKATWNPIFLRLVIFSTSALQAFLGYMLMLASMTFSAEILICILFGLALGYVSFLDVKEFYKDSKGGRKSSIISSAIVSGSLAFGLDDRLPTSRVVEESQEDEETIDVADAGNVDV